MTAESYIETMKEETLEIIEEVRELLSKRPTSAIIAALPTLIGSAIAMFPEEARGILIETVHEIIEETINDPDSFFQMEMN